MSLHWAEGKRLKPAVQVGTKRRFERNRKKPTLDFSGNSRIVAKFLRARENLKGHFFAHKVRHKKRDTPCDYVITFSNGRISGY